MIYSKENISQFKGDLKRAIVAWADDKVDTLFETNGQSKLIAYYLKNGFHNMIDIQDKRVNDIVDGLLLFVGDSSGNVDSDKLLDDLVTLFCETKDFEQDFGIAKLSLSKGNILIRFPDSFFTNLVFPWESIKITPDDLRELKKFLPS